MLYSKGEYLVHGLFDPEVSEQLQKFKELFKSLDNEIDSILPENGDKQQTLLKLAESYMWLDRCFKIIQQKKNIEAFKDE